ncbi:hypothetical protein [Streptomyces canus]|nr:hypothetical protein [Streptomyces canus]
MKTDPGRYPAGPSSRWLTNSPATAARIVVVGDLAQGVQRPGIVESVAAP